MAWGVLERAFRGDVRVGCLEDFISIDQNLFKFFKLNESVLLTGGSHPENNISAMTKIPFAWVDAFTDHPFSGNPAAVCILQEELDEQLMQKLAFEFGLSETAFVWPKGEEFGLRWFTPRAEVRLCGHATVAAATALWDQASLKSRKELTFQTLSGRLTARRKDGLVELIFPARPAKECSLPQGLLEVMELSQEEVEWCGRDVDDFLIHLKSRQRVESLAPDMGELAKLETRGLIFTAANPGPEAHFVSRFFAPRVGVDEDPVTGSAHCCLGPYWSNKFGLKKMSAQQLSERGGSLEVELLEGKVALRGSSYLLVRGEIEL